MNVPKLRFCEFSGEWEEKKLSEITKINQGLQIPISDRFTEQVENSFFYITNEFLKESSNKKYFIKNPSVSVLCNEDDILMTRTGNTGQVVTNVSGAFHNNFFKIKYDDCVEKNYLVYFLKMQKTQNKILSLAGTSTIPDLNHGDFYKIKMPLPSKQEQEKIASFLTSVDTKIEQLTKKKTLIEEYKKGVMQKIFAQEIRFSPKGTSSQAQGADDDGSEYPEWVEKKLGEICKIAKSGGTPTSTKKEYYDGNIPFLSISDMTSQGKYLQFTTNHISELGLLNSSSWIVPKNSIIYSMYASVGFVAINKISLATSQAVLNLILKEGVDLEFIYYTLIDFQKKVATFVTTGTQGNLNAQSVKGFKIHMPILKEQTKIANFLSSLDSKLLHVEKQLSSTKQFKKALLQQMFV